MDILKTTLPLLTGLLLSGCYENFDPGVEATPVLCVNSLITAGEPVEVSVQRTWAYMGPEGPFAVPDARVEVLVNGSEAPAGYLAREGDRIAITARSDSWGWRRGR